MSDGTKIEWTDATWNPITGCKIVSPGCTNCYAMKLAGTRLQHHPSRKGLTAGSKGGPVWTGEVRFNKEWLEQPLQWAKSRMIFVCAHGDLFAENVPDEWIDQIFAVMALSPRHTFQVLTKRPERMKDYCSGKWQSRILPHLWRLSKKPSHGEITLHTIGSALPNVWLGVSVEDQQRADLRIPLLLATPAAVRWISAEPLLGSVDLHSSLGGTLWLGGQRGCDGKHQHAGKTGEILHGVLHNFDPRLAHHHHDERCSNGLDWVVVGGESGNSSRPMRPEWARSIRKQCDEANVDFFFKQWGNCAPLPSAMIKDTMYRATKKIAGRLLDGIEHNAMPCLKRERLDR